MQRYRLKNDTMEPDQIGRWVRYDDAMEIIIAGRKQAQADQVEIDILRRINRALQKTVNEQTRVLRRAEALARVTV